MSDTCAWCDAPRTSDANCPRCGANYAKAEAIRRHGTAKGVVATAVPESASAKAAEHVPDDLPNYFKLVKDPQAEWLNCLLAMPVMLFGAWCCQLFNVFDGLQRIMFGMPVHEVGHALTAWLSGYNALPTFWFTHTASEQGYTCMLLLFAAYAALLRYGHRVRQRFYYAVVAVLLTLQLYATFNLTPSTSEMLIIFGGDALGMVIATAMMTTFYLGKETQLYKGSVRWGLLFWGAAAFMDIFMAWWEGQEDLSRVGYGRSSRAFSDAYRLINDFGWSWQAMFDRHLRVGYACLLAMLVMYSLGLWQAHGWRRQREHLDNLERIRLRDAGIQR